MAEVRSRSLSTWTPISQIKVVGQSGIQWVTPKNSDPGRDVSPLNTKFHDRTLRLGPGAERALRKIGRSTFAFIGGGGGNSATLDILKFFRPARIILIEPDRIELHNANRFFAFEQDDVGKAKTEVLKRMVERFHPGIAVECIPFYFPDERTVEALKRADVLVSFPDNDATRYQVAAFAARYHKPVFDAGTLVSYSGRDDPQRITARIQTQLPEGPCLHCLGVQGGYSREIEEEVRIAQSSYSDNPDLDPAPQVVTTNTFAATLLVRNILAFFYPGLVERIPTYLQFEELVPSIEDLSGLFPRNPNCPICGEGFEAERGWADVPPTNELFEHPADDVSMIRD